MFNYNNVRAQTLVTWGDFILYFRYNDFTHDPLSRCNCTPPYSAENAISARCDLNPANGTYPFGALGHRSHGGTDMKVTTFYPISLVQVLTCDDHLPVMSKDFLYWRLLQFPSFYDNQVYIPVFPCKVIAS